MAVHAQQLLWNLLVLVTFSIADDSDKNSQRRLHSTTEVEQPLPSESPQIVYQLHGIEVRPPHSTRKQDGIRYPPGLRRFLKPDLLGAPNYDPSILRRFAPYPLPGPMGIIPNLTGVSSNNPHLTDFPGPPIQPSYPGLIGAFGPNLHPGISSFSPRLPGGPSNFNPPYPTPVSGPPPWYHGPIGPNLHARISFFRPSVPGAISNLKPSVPGSAMQPGYRGPTGAFGFYPPLKLLEALATIRGMPLNRNSQQFPPGNQGFRPAFDPYLPDLSKGFDPNLPTGANLNLTPFQHQDLRGIRPGFHPYTKSYRPLPPLKRFNSRHNLPYTTLSPPNLSLHSTAVEVPKVPSLLLNSGPLAPPKNMKKAKSSESIQYPDDTRQGAQRNAIASPPGPGDLQAPLPPYLRVTVRGEHEQYHQQDVGYMDEEPRGDGYGVPVYSEEKYIVTRSTPAVSYESPVTRALRAGSTGPPAPPPLLSDEAAAYDAAFLYGEGILDEPSGRWLRVTKSDVTKQFLL